jgi:hypothetical protein
MFDLTDGVMTILVAAIVASLLVLVRSPPSPSVVRKNAACCMQDMSELLTVPALELGRRIRTRAVSCTDVVSFDLLSSVLYLP